MKKNGNRGFTIVELMMVVAVIAVLAGIITMGVSSMFRGARLRRAQAMKQILQAGLETYYAQHGEWPTGIKRHINDREDTVELDRDANSTTTGDRCPETDSVFQEIVEESIKQSARPVVDPSGLYVAQQGSVYCHDNHRRKGEHAYCGNKKCPRGRDFTEAVKNKKGQKKLNVKNMTFGYPGPNNGFFCRYRILFHPKTDTVEVKMQPVTEDNWKDD